MINCFEIFISIFYCLLAGKKCGASLGTEEPRYSPISSLQLDLKIDFSLFCLDFFLQKAVDMNQVYNKRPPLWRAKMLLNLLQIYISVSCDSVVNVVMCTICDACAVLTISC